ncbi:MAG: hypothetical protein IKX76_00630 [Eubacterium sp.]|nr:hypothetical protein [Eubacterium sp.]
MSNIIYIALEYFLVYSFLGWCTEVAYQAVKRGMIINRGFLNGPVCPIYGFGVLAVFRVLEAVGEGDLSRQNAFMVFIFGVILATVVEFLGGWILDKLFHARWWDYSDQPFNLHGYICLEFSIIWGLGILLVVRGVNPTITYLLGLVSRNIGWVLISVFCVILLADFSISVMVMAGLNKKMAEIDEMREKMRVVSNDLSERIGTRALKTAQHVDEAKVQAALARSEAIDQANQLRADYEAKKKELEQRRSDLISKIQNSRHFGYGRLLRAFPDMKHRDHSELLNMLKERL